MKFINFFLIVLILFSCQKGQENYFDKISKNDVQLPEPKYGDWRYHHPEKFQTFEDFQKLKKIVPSQNQKTIYLLPIGKFSDLERKEIYLTKDYLENFYQLSVKILNPISESEIPKNKKRILDNHEQLNAGYILDEVLLKEKPKDGLVLMAISQKDVFPKPEWNYVFGLASYEFGIGVTSMYRFHDGNLEETNFKNSLLRLMKISSHEIGHMFGLNHCLNANCVMNGTNNLPETDQHFARLCSLCQKKLNSTLKYDNKKRLIEIENFFKKNGFNFEAEQMEIDLDAVQ